MSEPTKSTGNKLVPVLVVLLIVAAFAIGSLLTQVQLLKQGTQTTAKAGTGTEVGTTGPQPAGDTQPPTQPVVKADVDISGAEVLGASDAKVVVVEFTDYQCPFCQRLYSDAMPQIKQEYVDTGKVKYIVMDYPLQQIHPQAQKAAEASHCAAEQGKYWEYHDTLFENQQALQVDDLKQYAADLGLNTSQFDSCLDSEKYKDKVADFQKRGEQYGVRGTPASYVGVIEGNTVKEAVQVAGAVGFDTFKTTIEEQLAKAN